MDIYMKKSKILFVISLCFMLLNQIFYNQLKAQNPVPGYTFSYDKSGNRQSRVFWQVVLKKGLDTAETKAAIGEYKLSIYPNPLNFIFSV